MKVRPETAGTRTDMTKLMVAFHNFANAPKKKKKVYTLYRTICCRISKIVSTLKILSCLRISSEMYCLSVHKA